ncbi:receptor-like protein 12 [Prunus yedoensis var. nudiflora]|uniref:Receptor-like protein 12 n=1 Tax=Prunus yedoensis var. nudiflora TaxID=2094558 RepID=A0A314Y0X9_PRUYE|nr:receptor-like protein 12 [Prunus yedoensis var. nudiflora]
MTLFSHPLLQKLQLSNNQFSGQLLEFANISVLETLDLSSNYLEGPIPMSIFNLRALKILSLSSNNFSGSFPLNGIQQLRNLSALDLSYNSLSITYDDTISSDSSIPQLTRLGLASGKLRRFPDFLRNQSYISFLDLSQNQIHGEIPNWIWRFNHLYELNLSCNSLITLEGPFLNLTSTLSMLDLHSNQLQGQIPIPPSASYLDYSRNNFSSTIRSDIGDFFTLTLFFSLSSNKFHGIIPDSICNGQDLEVLDLSNNSLSGMIPRCLTAMSDVLGVLNLQRNKLSGIIPDKFPSNCSLQTVELNENQIEGLFPNSLANCTMLEFLNVGNNRITDTFPCMLKSISTLRILVLRSNKFYEHIGCPDTNETWSMLQIVDIAHNNFSGEIPGKYLRTWRAMMHHKDDAMSNHFRFKVLKFSELYFQDAITVTDKGLEMELVKILTVFTSIDMSCNKFNGSIPEELGQLKSLYGLNLSNNALTGTIPSSLGNLRQLESLDLSKNSLSGPIPQEVGGLTFLSFLDLSNNQLVGQIPVSTQISTFPAASFAGNKGLWGPPLTVDNKAGLSPPAALNGSLPNSGHHGINWDLISVEIGFTLGFGFSILSLVLCKRWSKWYYRAMYNILLKIFPQLEERIGIHRRHVHINQRWRR